MMVIYTVADDVHDKPHYLFPGCRPCLEKIIGRSHSLCIIGRAGESDSSFQSYLRAHGVLLLLDKS